MSFRRAAYPQTMASQLTDAIAAAPFNEVERRLVVRIVAWLEAEVGDDLLAIWLYGSRARGEADPDETDPDRRSDIDMLVVLGVDGDEQALRWSVLPAVERMADAEGDSPIYYSVRVIGEGWLRDRRRIHSFFIQEVDRDKIVLVGTDLDEERYR